MGKFYTFEQNNTDGIYFDDGKVDLYVIIEADTADDANSIAQSVGIYFYGVDDGYDCHCCGDRWQHVDENYGKDSPEVFDKALDSQTGWILYKMDGTVERG